MVGERLPGLAPNLDLMLPDSDVSSTEHVVLFEGIFKRYGPVTALADVNISVQRGETVVLLGPNGAGKSTAINLLLALTEPDEGRIRVLSVPPREAVAAGKVGAMLQSGSAIGFPNGVSVMEVMELARKLYPRPLDMDILIELAGLGEFAYQRIDRLSGGQIQRVRFGWAIAGDPELIFLDEPTVGLDVESRRAFWKMMREFTGSGKTVLFATHYLEEADAIADRVVLLNKGKVVADGSPTTIKASVNQRTLRFNMEDTSVEELLCLPGVSHVEVRGKEVLITSTDSDETVRALCANQLPFEDLEVVGAALEDAFVALTAVESEIN
ncbi:MAG: ABC transporter ATP-binding protein [Actinobacteria bacterium]|jgi:ABC-2 type transport system ATP-binding protein|nr:ABC transporter ATP-binding protein [Actinomycetota bacterium]MCL6094311.1 ABC transporter ATP-binding protein [Actinomycetota bacterium]